MPTMNQNHGTPPAILSNHDGIFTLTLNRPEQMNALGAELVSQCQAICEALSSDNSVRVLIVTGAGDKAFCAGADLKERRGMNDQDVYQTVRTLKALTTAFAELPFPTIAAINGYAFGGGLELALAADIRLASHSAIMGLTETRLGIIPGAGGTQRLARLVGPSLAKELIFTARKLKAEAAQQAGVVSEVLDEDQLIPRAEQLARTIAKSAPLALREAKFAVDHGVEVELATGLAIESRAYDVLIPTEDRREALRAFQEKRQAEFEGK